MIKQRAWLLGLVLSVPIISGCDSYSLLDQFIPNGGLRLTPQTSTLRPGENSALFLEGGTPPYTVNAANGGLYEDDTAIDLGTINYADLDYSYTAGNSLGPVRIRLVDSLGFSTSTTITVTPRAPDSVVADGYYPGNSTVQIRWLYPYSDRIAGFRILRSLDGETFVTLADVGLLPKSQRDFVDESANPASLNIYRVYAVADSYQSAYVEVSAKGRLP
jgi:hypothetical protein